MAWRLGCWGSHTWQDHVNKWLPTVAWAQIWTANHPPHTTSASPIGVGGADVVPVDRLRGVLRVGGLALATGLILFRKRDARKPALSPTELALLRSTRHHELAINRQLVIGN